ncbi:MAG: polysaccharide deacetylase family protein [Chitinivibrionales bacterium]|nr:polysaccharide deacetylase family protein [Chitinivibrionales bacterium]
MFTKQRTTQYIQLVVFMTIIGIQLIHADSFKPSQKPPGNLDPKTVPQFVTFGWDDNGFADGINWILDFLKTKKNPNGTPVRNVFYITAGYGVDSASVRTAWKRAYDEGHEIGNHTFTHEEGMAAWSEAQWKATMDSATNFLVKECAIPREKIYGFRTPFLAYDQNGMNTHKGAKAAGFLYDCTLNGGSEGEFNGKDYFWPYTLDEGCNIGSEHFIKPVPGLWEVPTHRFRLTGGGHMTGFDYNLWVEMGQNKSQFLATLKNTLDLRYDGNRCPFTIGSHTDYYSEMNESANKECKSASWKERRAAIEEFINYALQKPDVRFVTPKTIVDYMKNPYTITNEPTAIVKSMTTKPSPVGFQKRGSTFQIRITDPGEYTLSFYDLKGKELYSAHSLLLSSGLHSVELPPALTARTMYLLKIQNSSGFHSASVFCTIN